MSSSLTPHRVQTLLASAAGKSILVVGDVMLDEFIWGTVRRISPEAPVPVVEVRGESYILGGAGNVAANIRALGGAAILLGITGRDAAAGRVHDLLRALNIEGSSLLAADRPTTVKTRVVAHNQQIVRADRENRDPLSAEDNSALAGAFAKWLPSVSAIVVSDYDKGVASRNLLAQILPQARDAGVPVYLDSKVQHADYYRPITLIKPNHREAELLTGMAIENECQLEEAGRRLLAKFDCPYALISRGEAGMSLFDHERSHHFPTTAREVFDVTGAGDTLIATLALAGAAGATIEEAAIMANHAAGLAVGKVGTATVSPAEILADFDAHHADSAG